MFLKDKTHHGKHIERKFAISGRYNEDYNAIAERYYKIGWQEGYESGKSEQRELCEKREKQESEKKKSEKRKQIFYSCLTLVAFVIVIVICACFCAAFERLFGKVCISVLFFLGIGVEHPIREMAKNNSFKEVKQKHENCLLTALKGAKIIWQGIRNNSMSIFLIMLSLSLLVGGVWGRYKISVCLEKGSEAFAETFMEYNPKEINSLSNPKEDSSDEENQSEAPDEVDLDNRVEQPERDDVSNGDAAYEMETFFEESNSSRDELSQIEIADKVIAQELKLSDGDYIAVFFTEGKYQIEDWEDQQEINDKIFKVVSDMRGEKKISIFDQAASQDMQDEIAIMKDRDEATKSFSEKESIKEKRKEVYKEFPKRSFTSLISNSEQWQALALIYYNGSQQSIMYHYVQSIIWDMEYLKYKGNTESDVRNRLLIIAKRYEDIAFICTSCNERKLAQKLQVAFENAAGQF